MRNKKILRKAAKKSLSWLLILGMLVTLPETPGAISAAAAELETGTEETVHEESGDADRVDETKNAVTEKTGETETKADTAVQEETGTSQSQETKEPGTETQDAEAENEDAEIRGCGSSSNRSRDPRCRNRGTCNRNNGR